MLQWFPKLFGFAECQQPGRDDCSAEIDPSRENYLKTRDQFEVISESKLKSLPNGRIFSMGKFSTPSLRELRAEVAARCGESRGKIQHEHIAISDVFRMHAEHPGATFQAASQFNCLEFGSPGITPEYGVTGYAYDETQGPACAVACAAGTVYRNYFADVHGSSGQSAENQINNLEQLEEIVNNREHNYWKIQNGYSFSDEQSLRSFNSELKEHWSTESKRDELLASVRVGVQARTAVTFSRRFVPFDSEQPEILVNQVYCSALSCGYAGVDNSYWEPLACIILDACYEATLLSSLVSAASSDLADGNHKVFLTFIGGGVFRNERHWIAKAIGTAIGKVEKVCPSGGLDIFICHYRRINDEMRDMIESARLEELSA